MKIAKLVLMTFLATALTGCIFVDDDDDDDGTDGDVVTEGEFIATWQWASGDCASEEVTDLSWLFTAASTNEGDEFLFSCTADSGEAGPLALDDYTYVVQALDCTGDTTPNCANGVQRGAPSAPVEDTFLNSDGSADCPNGVRGTTCIKALPTATLVLTQ